MPYLIDGHNLIPKMGLRLASMDDELELIAVLQEYCRIERKKQVEVYFDGAPMPHAGTRKQGLVTAHFVPQTTTADNAIRTRLKRLGKSAKNWTIVSSDHRVQLEARAAKAEVLSSETFAGMIKQVRDSASKTTNDRKLTAQEVEEWENIFENKKLK